MRFQVFLSFFFKKKNYLACMNFPKKLTSEHNLRKVTRQIG